MTESVQSEKTVQSETVPGDRTGRTGQATGAGAARSARPVNLAACFTRFTEQWAPRTIARLNDYEVKAARLQGEFVWHRHDDTDELFLVVDGRLTLQLRDGDVVLGPGELYVVPRGVEHCPRADEESSVVLLEPAGTVNTGNVGGPRTKAPVPLD